MKETLGERLATLEAQLDGVKEQLSKLAENAKKQDAIQNQLLSELARYKGFIGGVLWIGGCLWLALKFAFPFLVGKGS